MIIGINTLFLIPNRVGGTEYYTRSFLKYLEKLDKKNSYIVFCNKENIGTFDFKSNKWKKVLCPIRSSNRILRIFYEQIIFPFTVIANKCDILHSFGYFGPIMGKFKKFVTVHDANWKDCPNDIPWFQTIVMNILVSLNILAADVLLTDSEFSKSRLSRYFPKHKQKIKIIQGAIEDDFISHIRLNSNPIIKGEYLLNVSKFYPHKKISYLISLFKEIEKTDKTIKLVLVGQDGSEEELIKKMIKNDNRIIHFKKVKYPELVSLYKHASALVFPSIYEGFGYPVYEAVFANIPVFVGRREMYSPKIRDNIFQLKFDIKSDAEMIQKFSNNKINYPKIGTYFESINKLIKCYE